MKLETDGHAPARGAPTDPLEIAEALRDALADAAAKVGRLVSVLRLSGKQKKVLLGVLTSLKQLNLGAGEESR